MQPGSESAVPGLSGADGEPPFAPPPAERRSGRALLVAAGIAAAAAVTAILASSGGGGTPNAQQSDQAAALVASARRAIASASSVLVTGSVDSGGQVIGLRLKLVNGQGGEGTITARGASIQLIVVHRRGYMTTTAAGWRRLAGANGSEIAALFGGSWISLPPTGEFSSLFKLTNQNVLFARLLTSHGIFVKGATTTLNGEQVIGVTNTATSGTLYIATAGPPYPVEITRSGPNAGTIRFSNENLPVRLAAPPHPISLP